MGCSASHPDGFIGRDEHPSNSFSSRSQSPYSYSHSDYSSTPVSRTLSLPTPLVHHPPLCKGDSNHLVALTSTTYGSLVLIDHDPQNPNPNPNFKGQDISNGKPQLIMSQNGTDPQDPLSPDSVINTWELMEGLDELDFDMAHAPVESPKKPRSKDSDKGSFRKELDANEIVKTYEFVEHSDSKPLWKHLSEESLLAKMDPNVALSYRQALLSKRFESKESKDSSKPKVIRPVEPKDRSSLASGNVSYLKDADDRIVLYYTTLRGIRKTYEDCCMVRVIFRGFRVCVDERDISMDSSYRTELQDVLKGKAMSLPQVFIRGKYIGGAEEIKQLNEAGELARLLEGFPIKDSGFECEACGDARFLPCPNCNGSRKVYDEEEGKLRRCPHCNENGLIRCTSCCP